MTAPERQKDDLARYDKARALGKKAAALFAPLGDGPKADAMREARWAYLDKMAMDPGWYGDVTAEDLAASAEAFAEDHWEEHRMGADGDFDYEAYEDEVFERLCPMCDGGHGGRACPLEDLADYSGEPEWAL